MQSPLKLRAKVLGGVGFAFFAALVVWLTVKIGQGDLDRQDKFASVISMYVALITLPLTVVAVVMALGKRRESAAAIQLADQLDGVADTLAAAIGAQWEAEEQIRRIHDPFPLPIRWAAAPDYLSDHWQNIHRAPDRADPIPLSGQGDEIVDVFTRLPSRRLVVLGRAGAGKTILTSRFVLAMLAARNTGAAVPVPVLLFVGSWDPTTISLRNWVIGQLVADYPTLGVKDAAGTTIAARLLADHRIIVVLDGFDEISARLRVDAIRGINAGLGPDDGVLLTSRPNEYAAAVENGAVLTGAAVVELADLSIDDVIQYLPLTTSKPRLGQTHSKWHPVLECMRDPEHSAVGMALTAALSTPLMVALARASVSDTQADPTALWEVAAAPATDIDHRVRRVEEWLLSGFVPAVYSQPLTERSDARRRSWRIGDVQRWLGFLATHLDRMHTQDIAWWQLFRAVPQAMLGLATGLVAALPVFLAGVLGGLMATWHGEGLTMWTVGIGALGLLGGLASAAAVTLCGVRQPVRLRLRFAGEIGQAFRHMTNILRTRWAVLWIGVWVGGGLVCGLFASLISDLRGGVVSGVGGGLLIGVGVWFVVALVWGMATLVDPTETVSPAELLRLDRGTALWHGLVFSCLGVGVMVTVVWSQFELIHGLMEGGTFWIVGWLLGVPAATLLWILTVTSWGPWLLARTWLALNGELPWAAMTFLQEAHRRGVLRQAGGVYQFRHARLQNHLSTSYQTVTDSTAMPASDIRPAADAEAVKSGVAPD